MDTRPDTLAVQMGSESIPASGKDGEVVIGMLRSRSLSRHHQVQCSKILLEPGRHLPAGFDPSGYVGHFGLDECDLDRVQESWGASAIGKPGRIGFGISKLPDQARGFPVVGHYYAAVSESAQGLGCGEAIADRISEGAGATARELGPVCLAGVHDNLQPLASGDSFDRGHVRHLAVQVYR